MSQPALEPTADAPAGFLSRNQTLQLVFYNVILMFLLSAGMYMVISSAASIQYDQDKKTQETAVSQKNEAPSKPSPAAVAPVSAAENDSTGVADTVEKENAQSETPPALPEQTVPEVKPAASSSPITDPRMIAYVLFAITMAGGLGGTLCNLRGIFEFTRDNLGRFPRHLEMGFYLRPVSGVLCGLFTFFVSTFFAGALAPGDGSGWRTLDGMFPYIGIAFLAGFASQEFMEKLKDTARTLFGAATPAPEPQPEPETDTRQGQESLRHKPDSGGRESLSGDTDAGQEKEPIVPRPPRRPPGPTRKMAD
ncbi:MAG: hypothetical protein JNL02_12905 [Saprospiraceae bacterium]|nr:hypothetical protein [Saprospiraceae bacterium]